MPAGSQATTRLDAGNREQNSGRAAGQRERQRFGEQLRDQPRAVGAQRGAHRKLVQAAGAARQKQNRDVRAADRQQHSHGAEEQEQRSPEAAGDGAGQAADAHSKVRQEMPRRFAGELLQQRLHDCLGPRVADARFEPRVDDIDAVGIRRHGERRVHVAVAPAETGRHHADDHVVLTIQLQRLAESRRHARRSGAASMGD